LPSNVKFGIFLSLLFFATAFLNLGKFLYICLFSLLGLISLGISYFRPDLFRNLNQFWFKFGEFLGKITNPFILGFLFFFFITPLAFYFRLIKKDLLNITGTQQNFSSFWKQRNDSNFSIEFFKNQF
jgi:hypothetical protein